MTALKWDDARKRDVVRDRGPAAPDDEKLVSPQTLGAYVRWEAARHEAGGALPVTVQRRLRAHARRMAP